LIKEVRQLNQQAINISTSPNNAGSEEKKKSEQLEEKVITNKSEVEKIISIEPELGKITDTEPNMKEITKIQPEVKAEEPIKEPIRAIHGNEELHPIEVYLMENFGAKRSD